MLQLAYTSVANSKWDGDLHALCSRAAERNIREEVTGILMLRNRFFLQVLEGPKAIVEDAFVRIITDERHDSLELLSRRMLTKREFGDWAMAEMVAPDDMRVAVAMVGNILALAERSAKVVFMERFGSVVAIS